MRLQLPEHLYVPALKAVLFVEPENAPNVFGRRIEQGIRHPLPFSLCQKLIDQPAADAPPSELRRDVKIVNLKIAFAFPDDRRAFTAVNRAGDEADDLAVGFGDQKVRA